MDYTLQNIISAGSSLLTGLTHYWTLDEQSGTRNDSVGTAHLTDNNTVGYAAGKNGNAANVIRANNEYLSVATPATLQPNAQRSVSLWFKVNNVGLVGPGQGGGILSCAATSTSGSPRWLINHSNTSGLRFFVNGGYNAIGTVVQGQWHHLAWTFTGSQHNFYLDGGSATIINANENVGDSGANFFVGSGFDQPAEEDLDELAAWNKILTSDERTTLYNAGVGKFYPSF